MEIFPETYIRNLLKCKQCGNNLDENDQPIKSLQCGNIICAICETRIEKNAINSQFKCEICTEDHMIPANGFVVNQLACHLIKSKPQSIWRGKRYEKLKLNLNTLNRLSRELKFNYENGNVNVKDYCNEQKRRVQFAFENKMKELNDLNEAFMKKIDDYEENCMEQSKLSDETTKTRIEKLITETNSFTCEKQNYLNQLEVNKEEIESFNMISQDLELKLENELTNCKIVSFGNKLLKFNSNSSETLIGAIDYERINPTELLSISGDNTIKLLSYDSDECISKQISLNHSESAICLKQASYNKLIIGYSNGIIRIIDIASDTCLKVINEHSDYVSCIQMISNDKFITCSHDKSIKFFDLNTSYCIRTFKGHEKEVNFIDKTQDNKIISGSNENTVKVWDLSSGECLKTLQGHSEPVWCVLAVSNKQILSGSMDNCIKLWDIESGECLRTFQGHSAGVSCIVKISTEQIASCSYDKRIKIWNINTGECSMTMEDCSNNVKYLFLQKLNNNRIISGSDDNEIKLWHLDTGQCFKSFKVHNDYILQLEILK